MVCNRCGTDNQMNTRFCVNCGADLMEQMQAEQQSQQMYQQPNYQQQDYQQPSYQQPNYQPQMYQQPTTSADPGRGMAIASLVLGIISFICLPAVTGVLGIIFGCVARNKGSKSPMAMAGIICGAIGIALWILMLIFGASISSIGLDAFAG